MESMDKVKNLLKKIYGEETGRQGVERLTSIIEKYASQKRKNETYFSQEDVVLITYGDSLKKDGEAPLATLHAFANQYLKGAISNIHFLPFFPYSSDDGFSVMDFFEIDPELGTWQEVAAIGQDFELMFDYVVNHYSSKGQWFQNYLDGKEGFTEFAMEVDPAIDLSMVTRPRSLPLLSKYQKKDGQTVHLWTTFSADQIDFNFKSLDVLEKMIDVLLFYADQGATILRLDAIAYLWKEIGTTCIGSGGPGCDHFNGNQCPP
jgi:sucrose phosphorylase